MSAAQSASTYPRIATRNEIWSFDSISKGYEIREAIAVYSIVYSRRYDDKGTGIRITFWFALGRVIGDVKRRTPDIKCMMPNQEQCGPPIDPLFYSLRVAGQIRGLHYSLHIPTKLYNYFFSQMLV